MKQIAVSWKYKYPYSMSIKKKTEIFQICPQYVQICLQYVQMYAQYYKFQTIAYFSMYSV